MSNEPSLPNLRPIHPFPARMAPAIVWEELIAAAVSSARDPLRVLDPMAGSGTTVAMARLLGHYAEGFDTDPLAVLIARAWSADLNPLELREAASEVTLAAYQIAQSIDLDNAYPEGADEETRRFIKYWFDDSARLHLTALSASIKAFENGYLRPLLWCTLSRLIIVKSMGASLAMDVAHSRPHRVYKIAPIEPLRRFAHAASVVAKNAPFADKMIRPHATVREGDARKLLVQDGSADFVITSPPYLNAIDYMRGHRLSLVWMDYTVSSLRQIRAANVGTEISSRLIDTKTHLTMALNCMGEIDNLPNRDLGMLKRYVSDMDTVISEIARVLTVKGRAVLVVGDSTLRGVFIQNSKALALLGEENGLRLVDTKRRPLPPNRRYLPPPCADGAGKQLESRMRDEVILSFSRFA